MIFKDKPPVSDNLLKKRISRIVLERSNYDQSVADVISNLYDYMRTKKLRGGCHALSSALYVAFSEMNLNSSLYIGNCQLAGKPPFDHSWISIKDEIIDLAIYVPLTSAINSMSGPIIFGVDAVTLKPSQVEYGINTGLPFDGDTQQVINMPFSEYMSRFPGEQRGLWTVVQKILPSETCTSIDALIMKYSDVNRICVR